jgi:hypothetical protein
LNLDLGINIERQKCKIGTVERVNGGDEGEIDKLHLHI